MGGVVTDLDGRTTLPGLFAVGEVRTGGTGEPSGVQLPARGGFGARARCADDALASHAGARTPAAVRPPMEDRGSDTPEFSRAALQQLMG
ncbi:FAD-binding protein [Microbacterium sp.]|uniref:FAD-binding protein n=1 Tax=Microbacterium sp. TaxID=51671 RepID=UPI003A8F8987